MTARNFITQPGSQFLPEGTDAVERTVSDKLRDVVSVKDFGALGDGSTDDTAAIQAAIDYASSINGGIVLLNGNFRYSSDITVKENVILQGNSGFGDSTLTNTSSTASIILLGGVVLKDLTISAGNNFTGNLIFIGDGESSTNNQNPINIQNISLFGTRTNVGGVGIALTPDFVKTKPITFLTADSIKIRDFDIGINLVSSASSWVNSNSFLNIVMSACRQYINCDKTAGKEVSGNYFYGSIQSNETLNNTGNPGIYINGSFNVLDLLVWDWRLEWETPWLEITADSTCTSVRRLTVQEQIKNNSTSTFLGTTFNNMVAHSSQPLLPMAFGNSGVNYEDNDLDSADKRFGVTYSVAPDSGAGALFTRTASSTTRWLSYSGDVEITVDLTSGPESLVSTSLLGAGITFTQNPNEIRFYVRDRVTSNWSLLRSRIFRFSEYYAYILSTAYNQVDDIDAIRVTFTNNSARTVSISHFFARFSNIKQGTYLLTNGSNFYGDLIAPNHAYNDSRIRLGDNYLWVDTSGKLRIKSSEPTSDTDGTVVGTQT